MSMPMYGTDPALDTNVTEIYISIIRRERQVSLKWWRSENVLHADDLYRWNRPLRNEQGVYVAAW